MTRPRPTAPAHGRHHRAPLTDASEKGQQVSHDWSVIAADVIERLRRDGTPIPDLTPP